MTMTLGPTFEICERTFTPRDPAGNGGSVIAGFGPVQAGIDPARAPDIEPGAEKGREIPERGEIRALADGGNGTHQGGCLDGNLQAPGLSDS